MATEELTPLNKVAKEIQAMRTDKGFYTPTSLLTTNDRDMMLGKLMLVVTELAEAAEDVRDGNYVHFYEEIADSIIRLFDIAATTEMDIDYEVRTKMEKNRLRPFLHGRKSTL